MSVFVKKKLNHIYHFNSVCLRNLEIIFNIKIKTNVTIFFKINFFSNNKLNFRSLKFK